MIQKRRSRSAWMADPGQPWRPPLPSVEEAAEETALPMANRKSVLLSLVLTFFLGPFGMFYSTITGGIVMLVLYLALGIPTLGWAIIGLHPIAMIWGAWAADRANR